jgi:predicted transcriptional regulator
MDLKNSPIARRNALSDALPKRRGRPPNPFREKRQNYTFRIRNDLRGALKVLAKQSGRSVSEEIEYRLERSVERDAVEEWLKSFARELLAEPQDPETAL